MIQVNQCNHTGSNEKVKVRKRPSEDGTRVNQGRRNVALPMP